LPRSIAGLPAGRSGALGTADGLETTVSGLAPLAGEAPGLMAFSSGVTGFAGLGTCVWTPGFTAFSPEAAGLAGFATWVPGFSMRPAGPG